MSEASSHALTPLDIAEEIFHRLGFKEIAIPEAEDGGASESISGSPSVNADYVVTVNTGRPTSKDLTTEIACGRSLLAQPGILSAEQREEIHRLVEKRNSELSREGVVHFDEETMVVSVSYVLSAGLCAPEHLPPTMETLINWCVEVSRAFREETEPIIEGKIPLLQPPTHASRFCGHA